MSQTLIELQLSSSAPGAQLLDAAARDLLGALQERFAAPLAELLAARQQRQAAFNAGNLPAIETIESAADWQIAEVPPDLRDRRVECYVRADGSDLALANNASTRVFDLDAILPAHGAALAGHQARLDAEQRHDQVPASPLIIALRSIAATEPALCRDAVPLNAALVDLAILLRHHRDGGLYLQLVDVDSPAEARFWASLFQYVEASGILAAGQLRVTVGIESVTAVFAAETILHELRDFACALSGDRLRYLQSFARRFCAFPRRLLPDRSLLSTSEHFLRCWCLRLVQTAHRHGASAIGPCADALVHGKVADRRLRSRLRADKERHAHDGFDGSGVADARLIDVAREVFDRLMPGQHQQHRMRADRHVSGADLLQAPTGKITEPGIRSSLQVALAGLLETAGAGTVLPQRASRNVRQDVEFAAIQLRQWVRHATGVLDDGRIIDGALFAALLQEEARAFESVPALAPAQERLEQFVLSDPEPGDLLAANA